MDINEISDISENHVENTVSCKIQKEIEQAISEKDIIYVAEEIKLDISASDQYSDMIFQRNVNYISDSTKQCQDRKDNLKEKVNLKKSLFACDFCNKLFQENNPL